MPVIVDRRPQGVAVISIDRPAKLNALNSETLHALAERTAELGRDPALRMIVLRGAGERAFASGADLGEMAALSGTEAARRFITRVHQACAAVRAVPVPVVARIVGPCLGAGLELAASCDLRVAATNARFAMPEVKLGLPSVVEAAVLPRLIGLGRANRMLFTGETIGAAEALNWGLVEDVVPEHAIDDAIQNLTETILRAGPQAVRLQKALIAEWQELPLSGAIAAGIDCFARAWEGDEPHAMLGARPRKG